MIALSVMIGLAFLPSINDLNRLGSSLTRIAASGVEALERNFPRGLTVCDDSPDEDVRPGSPVSSTRNGCGILFALAAYQGHDVRKGASMEHPVNLDEDTPKGAMKALQAAFGAGDEMKIRSLTRAKTQEQRRALRAKVRVWAQVEPFYDALCDRFEQREVNEFSLGLLGFMFTTRWIDLDKSVTEIDGDIAILSDGHDLQKMIREDGHWRAYFDDWDEETVARLLALPESFAEALRQTTLEVRAGKYETIKEVSRAVTERAEAAKMREPAKDLGGRSERIRGRSG